MSQAVSPVAVSEAVGWIRAGVDTLLGADLSPLASAELTELLTDLEVQRRRCEAIDQRLLAAIGERGIAGEYGNTGPVDLLISLLRVSPREAKARVGRARDLGPRRALTGEPLEPALPRLADAVAAGAVSAEHAQVIIRTVEEIPASVPDEVVGTVEQSLVAYASHAHPGQVGQAGQLLLARLDPDGPEPAAEEAARRREFGLRVRRDGTSSVHGQLTAEATATWRAILDTLAAPQPQAADGSDVVSDPRSATQRRHDALLEAGLRLLRSGTLPDCGGTPVTILATVHEHQLRAAVVAYHAARISTGEPGTGQYTAASMPRSALAWERDWPPLLDGITCPDRGLHSGNSAGWAWTAHGDLLTVHDLLRLASEAELISVLFDPNGGVTSYGHTRRLASPGQRRALTARDKGCAFPGCARPPAWCEVHHALPWIAGGRTDLANLVLLCGYHHRNFEALGWQLRMIGGVPEWIPPPWLDAEQAPRRNTAHHLDNFDFRTEGFDTG